MIGCDKKNVFCYENEQDAFFLFCEKMHKD